MYKPLEKHMFDNIDNLSFGTPRGERTLEDYQNGNPRWCTGCGNFAILTALQRLCRDEQLPPEKTVCVSGIGCSSRFPHYMKTYGFHSLHGRAFPIAEGVKMRCPDLNVFVNTGDGDCCSIGTAHWIHAVRYNMNLTVMMHDNNIYGLTKMQASPTSPQGLKSNTSPRGAYLEPLNPLSVTLAVSNVSFVAQVADWIPGLLYQTLSEAFHHKGFSFIRILQRCPNYLPNQFDQWIQDPGLTTVLTHEDGLTLSSSMKRVYRHVNHDPSDLDRAMELAMKDDKRVVGILYKNAKVPCYEDIRRPTKAFTSHMSRVALEGEFDKFEVGSQRA